MSSLGVVATTLIGVATFFCESGVKLDEKSIGNGLEGQKFLVVCLFWGGCHHPNFFYRITQDNVTELGSSKARFSS